MEKSEQFSGIDIGKIGALHDSGWDNSDIASDMELDAETVGKVLEYRGTHQEEPEKEPESVKYVIMPEEEMNAAFDRAASIGAREAVKRFEQERRKDIKHRSDRRLHNTRILLRNYRALKEHAESAVFSCAQMDESALEILDSFMQGENTDVEIDSIRRSAERTAVMLSHIDAMIGLYEAYCDKSKDSSLEKRRLEVMRDMYISEVELSADEIAEKQNMSKQNVYKDLKMAVERMTALLFGVDGMRL